MLVTLQIVPANQPRRPAVAWFVSGSDPRVWLEEVSRWDVPLANLILRPVSRSLSDRTPLGLLISASAKESLPDVRKLGSLAIPFGCVAGHLYLPIDADILPCVSDAELSTLLPRDGSDLIWHPVAGLVRCEPTERLSVPDLVQVPEATPSRWDFAVPGIRFRSRLVSIEPTEQPSADDVLNAARQDIGTQSSSIDELPPTPGEGLSGQVHNWTRPLRQAWKSFFKSDKKPPATPTDPSKSAQRTPAQGLGTGWMQWFSQAAGPLAAAGNALSRLIPRSLIDQAARLREIDRLMHLLQNDPDLGLKFALPMGGGDAGRGIGAASNQLLPRDTNFNLSNLGGGHRVDAWDIPAAQQFQLLQMYRELAAREVRMGRHRRAAYIFAELLGDLQAAAGALESGGHYREAAVLYRDRLNRPQDQARCLERGGLLDEAAEVYLELGMMENAAEMYRRLERHDEAERLLRNWVDQLARQGSYLQASDVLHRKLHDVDGAIKVLDHCWSLRAIRTDAEACLKQIFGLLGEHSRHDNARDRIAVLRTTEFVRDDVAARVLAGVAANYVDQDVRAHAADTTRVIVARRLPSLAPAEAGVLLSSLRALAPHDRLLGRDCDRFVRQQEASRSKQRARLAGRTSGLMRLDSFDLKGPEVQWRMARATGSALYVAGFARGGLLLRRTPWSKTESSQDAFWSNISNERRILLDVPPGDTELIRIHVVGEANLGMRGFHTDGTVRGWELAGSPPWVTDSTVAFACSDGGAFSWRVRAVFGMLELAGFGPKADELTNGMLRVSVSEDALTSVPVTVCASAKPIRIGVGRHVCRPLFNTAEANAIDADEKRLADQFVELDADIVSLHNHRDTTTDCVVALFGDGGVMIREPIHENSPRSIGSGMEDPVGTFLQDGTFIVAGRHECRAYRFDENVVNQIGEIPLDSPAIGVTRTRSLGQFAVICRDGHVRVFGYNRR
jgi:tetratricopeptide (TPR) repeat protein